MAKPIILIATSGFDRDLIKPVVRQLDSRGFEIITYEADAVVHGVDSLTIRIDEAAIYYKGKPLDLGSVAAAWRRRPNQFFTSNLEDRGRDASLSIEYKTMQTFLWDAVPDGAWLNHPEAMEACRQQTVTAHHGPVCRI
jgi:hypothetical protein